MVLKLAEQWLKWPNTTHIDDISFNTGSKRVLGYRFSVPFLCLQQNGIVAKDETVKKNIFTCFKLWFESKLYNKLHNK